MGLHGFERRLENLVEGVFSRVFRSGLRPIEIGRRLAREMDAHRTVDVRGRTVVPNHYTVHLSEEDFANFAEIGETLARELCDAAREHGRDEGYAFLGPVTVELVVDPQIRAGEFRLDSRMKEGEAAAASASSLLLPNHDHYVLGDQPVSIGRMPDNDITIADSNVSRKHAEIRPVDGGYALVDLGSTNGCRVNGVRVTERRLADGDELAFGNIRLVFQQA
ncbi:MAG: DUF3662 and FHA domain-containing protein [Acidimicrobiales bacterium]|nr:DUF3662 and FHA domain-containing protein [Acidimicrobiales bacterium]MCB1258933.1 DUF3662 and FHA domain-containing protein [Acidimicrobiales bacterium]